MTNQSNNNTFDNVDPTKKKRIKWTDEEKKDLISIMKGNMSVDVSLRLFVEKHGNQRTINSCHMMMRRLRKKGLEKQV